MLIALAYILRHVTTDGRLRSFNGQIQMTSALFPYKSTFKNGPHVESSFPALHSSCSIKRFMRSFHLLDLINLLSNVNWSAGKAELT